MNVIDPMMTPTLDYASPGEPREMSAVVAEMFEHEMANAHVWPTPGTVRLMVWTMMGAAAVGGMVAMFFV